jgi:hypothetical protein
MLAVEEPSSNYQVGLTQENGPAGCFKSLNINVSDFWGIFAS